MRKKQWAAVQVLRDALYAFWHKGGSVADIVDAAQEFINSIDDPPKTT